MEENVNGLANFAGGLFSFVLFQLTKPILRFLYIKLCIILSLCNNNKSDDLVAIATRLVVLNLTHILSYFMPYIFLAFNANNNCNLFFLGTYYADYLLMYIILFMGAEYTVYLLKMEDMFLSISTTKSRKKQNTFDTFHCSFNILVNCCIRFICIQIYAGVGKFWWF